MKNKFKKYGIIVLIIALVMILGTNALGTDSEVVVDTEEIQNVGQNHSSMELTSEELTSEELAKPDKLEVEVEKPQNDKAEQTKNSEEMSETSDKIINRRDKKAERIAELTDKYNDEWMAITAYYLEVIQKYSFPICFIGLAMGAFNFLIIGNKKLDKKEQGFAWIVGFTIGLVAFNVIPLLFALIVAGK